MSLKVGQKVNLVGKIESINEFLVGIEIESEMGSSFVFVDRETVERPESKQACFPIRKVSKKKKKKILPTLYI